MRSYHAIRKCSFRITSSFRLTPSFGRLRSYHSFPDPNEKPVISQYKSTLSTVAAIPKDLDALVMSPLSSYSMDTQYPGFESHKNASNALPLIPIVQSTTLSNGMTVASQDNHGLMSSFAFVMGAGSAYENQDILSKDYSGGVTQMMEVLAFKSTTSMSENDIKTQIEKLGGMVQCVANRESILFCVDVLRPNIEPALELLADTVFNPLFSEETLAHGRDIMGFMSEEARAEILSRDAAVLAAYPNQPLGNFYFCPLNKTPHISEAAITNFRGTHLSCYINLEPFN